MYIVQSSIKNHAKTEIKQNDKVMYFRISMTKL